ncbi:HD-like signal output (HDOD) protein [Silvimonas terrae]|uniref:HD-like signal output (HDOD) protein n=1 Tax=Silvimonas terrae TaxID=300266 RepID=A0A840R9P3_9NEIS|nr:HDOD domain-containing protein [Silvimonas terrae]MBB5190075.1 HD-like signal output (HDOD) protein [Silvimonas terrae]
MPATFKNRFQLLRILGEGAQGRIWLAHDTQAGRDVAVRLGAKGDEEAVGLQHPGLVTLLEQVEAEDQPALVYEYVQGTRLDGQYFTVATAVDLLIDLLDALAALHAAGLTHGHVHAHNVVMDAQHRPRLMDVGNGRGSAPADVQAAGQLFYNMLTERPAPGAPASASKRAELDARLDPIIANTQQAKPPAADALRDALRDWRGDMNTKVIDATTGTLDFLLRRMRHTNDFPALSQAISAINKINQGDSERLQVLSSVILNDFSLVNKLLRIVNSASYGQYGGTISTISRAIVILGFDTIRNLATTLLLFEHMNNKSHAAQLREGVLQAFYGGLLARQIALECGSREAEESLICGMFNHLGRLLTIYYFPEEFREISRRIFSGTSETSAVIAVLGLSWDELGMGVARSWLFPDRIINAMRPLPEGMVREPASANERLRAHANLSARLVPLVGQPPSRLAEPTRLFAPATGLDVRDIQRVMKAAATALHGYLGAIGIDLRSSVFLQTLLRDGTEHGQQDALEDLVLATPPQTGSDAASVLSAGVQDITQSLVSNFNLNDVLRMILEAMYRGVGFDRVLFCTRDAKKPVVQARFGFGSDIAAVAPVFQVDMTGKDDVFQAALERNLDVLIEDVDAPSIALHVPAWYRQQVGAGTFVLFPLKVGERMIGFFYGDKQEAGSLKIEPNALNLLKTLRNQAVLAIRTRQ